jgi:amino acid transporter
MILLIGLAAGAGVLSFGVYFSQFLSVFGLGYSRWVLLGTSVACLAVTYWLARVGAKPAAWVMFVTEILATIAMLVVFVAVLVAHRDNWLDSSQLNLTGSSFSVVISAVVVAVAGFGGFESASVYGKEASNPHRTIPIAMVLSALLAGVIWMFAGYVLYLGFQYSSTTVAKSPAPMGTLAQVAGIGWYSHVVDISLAFTIGASLIAVFSWVARMMYTTSAEGVAPKSWSRIHPKYQTPSTALTQAGVVWLVAIVAMCFISDNPLDTFGDFIGDLSGYPLLLVYGLVCAGAIWYDWKQRGRATTWTFVGVMGVGGMAYVLYKNVVPFPGWPSNLVVGLFAAATVATCIAYGVLRERRSSVLAEVGSSVVEDTSVSPADSR